MSQRSRAAGTTTWVVITLGVVTVAVLLATVWAIQRSFIYFPDSNDPGSAWQRFPDGMDVELHTSDGLVLSTWRIEPEEPNGMAVLFMPGNGGNRAGRADLAAAIAEEGFVVLLLEYRGYGGNPGAPSEEGLLLDAQAAVEYLVGEGFSPERLIYAGESLGTGVATALAVINPPAALLLRSPFSSLADAASNQVGIPVGWLLRDRFDTLSKISDVVCPVSILAGDRDDLVPLSQSREVADGVTTLHEFLVVPNADHNDSLWYGGFVAEHLSSLASVAMR